MIPALWGQLFMLTGIFAASIMVAEMIQTGVVAATKKSNFKNTDDQDPPQS